MMLTVGSYTDVGEMELKQLRGRTTDTTMITEDTASSGTCRCLFGPVDPADNAAALASLRAVMDRLNAARWGYDFSTGRPLPGGRFEWTEVDHRRSSHTGNDVRDRAVLQQVNGETIMTSSDHVTMTPSFELLTSFPPTKRRRPAVTSSLRRRRKIARSDDVIGNVAVCPPASQQHRIARCQRHSITGMYTPVYSRIVIC